MTSPAASVRRATIDRIPLYRRVFAPQPRGRLPRWARRLLMLLALVLLLAIALVSCHESEKPIALATSTLVGDRLVTGPICIEEAIDVSGSMVAFRAQREEAENELFAFARRELAPNDLFSSAFFAGTGRISLLPTPLSVLNAPPSVPDGLDYNNTRLAPAVDALVDARAGVPSAQTCAARALVVITDGILGDDQAELETSLRKGSYTRIFAVIPAETGWGRPSALSGGIRKSISVYHFAGTGFAGRAASIFADAKPLDVVFGDIIGSLTGQQLAQAK